MAKKKDQSYWENVIKEFGESRRARNTANEAQANYRYGGYAPGSSERRSDFDVSRARREMAKAHQEERSAFGQLAGAVLQGRQYKKSGKKK